MDDTLKEGPSCQADSRTKFVASMADRLLDKRTMMAQRRRELIGEFTKALGGEAAIDATLARKVAEAAEAVVIAEAVRASFLAGSGATADDCVRASRQAELSERRLLAGRQVAPAKPDLASYLATKVAA